jgi:hypothetical protein
LVQEKDLYLSLTYLQTLEIALSKSRIRGRRYKVKERTRKSRIRGRRYKVKERTSRIRGRRYKVKE